MPRRRSPPLLDMTTASLQSAWGQLCPRWVKSAVETVSRVDMAVGATVVSVRVTVTTIERYRRRLIRDCEARPRAIAHCGQSVIQTRVSRPFFFADVTQ